MMTNIMHICNNYVASKVHLNLIKSISNLGFKHQNVFIAIRCQSQFNLNQIQDNSINLNYCYCVKPGLKFFPMLKVLVVFTNYLTSIKSKPPQYVIAHTLWSDGSIAYLYYLFTGTPYIVVVRNTDMNIFIPKLLHYRWFIKRIIKNSNGLIFVNQSYANDFKRKYRSLYDESISTNVINNGIDEFWINNFYNKKNKRLKQVCFVGRFDNNKNIPNIIKSVAIARISEPNITLKLVGGSKNQLMNVLGNEEIPSWVTIEGIISDKLTLSKIYRESRVFLMPSFTETFGLVYIESISQGCPVIYTKGQGIDGIFNEDIAKSVNPTDIKQISESILYFINTYPFGIYNKICKDFLIKNFSWEFIAEEYIKKLEPKV